MGDIRETSEKVFDSNPPAPGCADHVSTKIGCDACHAAAIYELLLARGKCESLERRHAKAVEMLRSKAGT